MSVRPLASVLDFVMRLVYFAAAPFLVVFAAALFPVSGAVLQLALALGVFFLAESVRGLAARSRAVRYVVSGQLEFEEFYRAHPPRPFLYYVFYPLLFPYWLVVRDARREFWIYKGYSIATFLWLIGATGVTILGHASLMDRPIENAFSEEAV